MSGWVFKPQYGDLEVDIEANYRNVTGSPVVSVTVIPVRSSGAASLISGVYRFTFESAATISVACPDIGDSKNPLLFSGTRNVICDGVTPNYNVIPGLSVIFSASATTDDMFEIGIGCYWDSYDGAWIRFLALGLGLQGQESKETLLYVVNETGYTQCNSKIYATNAVRIENGVAYNRPFLCWRQVGSTNPVADSDLAGAQVTFNNVGGGTCDILVNGAPIGIYDVTAQRLIPGGIGLSHDGTTVYRFADGTKYQSCEFILSASLTETDTATIFVSDGASVVEVSSNGADWVSGETGIYLVQEGENPGIVVNGSNVSFYIRISVSVAKSPVMNQRTFSLRVTSQGA